MRLISILRQSSFHVLTVIFFIGFLLGILNVHFSDKNDYCIMTYMYEYPQFVRIAFEENNNYPQYGLYAYSEGRLTEKTRRMWFDGIPVLFLPGNSGSHMQARSLASVALRKSLARGYENHFDFFTVSFNEELSGLYGGVLEKQVDFAAASIHKILSLYKTSKYSKPAPKSVILIGHSMGGFVAKYLLAHSKTLNCTNIAITLAAPLDFPVINTDKYMNRAYMHMKESWKKNVLKDQYVRNKKLLLSIGNGARDLLVPPGLTSSSHSYINALTTAIPGVWVSPDHVGIVWCKQLVMVINGFLFSIVDIKTQQISENQPLLKSKARQYFQANNSMTLSPSIIRANVTMTADAFWYEDNRRIYQVARPEIEKTTHLMIRLVKYPQNRFVAIQAVNVDDKDWVFGCNAKYTHNMHRYCKHAISLSELSRWTGAAIDHPKRKMATIHLHSLMQAHPEWTHVIVRVSPTGKPVTLNVDTNDHESRKIHVHLPTFVETGKKVIIKETEKDSLYYELILRDYSMVHEVYLLHVEPTESCKTTKYHVSAEMQVPWNKNHETIHYFTNSKRSPMKLRLFKSDPKVMAGGLQTQFVKVTLLLDPQCTFTVSVSTSWYLRLAQMVRSYGLVVIPYLGAIVLLTVNTNITKLGVFGYCPSVIFSLLTENIKPYFSLVFARAVTTFITTSLLSPIFANESWENEDLQYFMTSIFVIPVYIVGIAITLISVTTLIAVALFCSQLGNRLLCRILFRGGTGFSERVSAALQHFPDVVSIAMLFSAPLACGAVSLTIGAVFYGILISKMYEDYLEDYFYKLLATIAYKLRCMLFKKSAKTTQKKKVDLDAFEQEGLQKEKSKNEKVKSKKESADALNKLNFHVMIYLMWLVVTLINIPVLLTWAKNFKYSMRLMPDPSYEMACILSFCTIPIWRIHEPRRFLKNSDLVSSVMYPTAVFILAIGPFSLSFVNYSVAFMILVIMLHQRYDYEDPQLVYTPPSQPPPGDDQWRPIRKDETNDNPDTNDIGTDPKPPKDQECNACGGCESCDPNAMFQIFRSIQDRMELQENLL